MLSFNEVLTLLSSVPNPFFANKGVRSLSAIFPILHTDQFNAEQSEKATRLQAVS